MGRYVQAMVMVAGLVVFVSGCRPRPGGSCSTPDGELCADPETALACHDGKWDLMKCKGPTGCTGKGAKSHCDQATAEDSDVCNVKDNFACRKDAKAMLQCQANRWALAATCLGPNGCSLNGTTIKCDNSLARAGEPCTRDEYACTTDKQSALVCRNKKFELIGSCRGPKACSVGADKIECDESFAQAGETCERNGNAACAVDAKSILVCKDNKWAVDQLCKRTPCKVVGTTIDCK